MSSKYITQVADTEFFEANVTLPVGLNIPFDVLKIAIDKYEKDSISQKISIGTVVRKNDPPVKEKRLGDVTHLVTNLQSTNDNKIVCRIVFLNTPLSKIVQEVLKKGGKYYLRFEGSYDQNKNDNPIDMLFIESISLVMEF